MKYPRPAAGPRTQKKRARERAKKPPPPELPYELVMKKLHGQHVWVKVYEPAYARGDEAQALSLGLKPTNRFSRDRGAALERKAPKPKKTANSAQKPSPVGKTHTT